jgi:hypothetical protein
MIERDHCCCNKIIDFEEPIVINDIVHEKSGPAGNFCGSLINHELRDLRNKLDIAMYELNDIIAYRDHEIDAHKHNNLPACVVCSAEKVLAKICGTFVTKNSTEPLCNFCRQPYNNVVQTFLGHQCTPSQYKEKEKK